MVKLLSRHVFNKREKNMIEILRDPIWQFVLGTLAVIISIIAIAIGIRSLSKRLVYDVITQTSLVNIAPLSVVNRVKIYFDDNPVENAELILIKIINTGMNPIKTDDFETPLMLYLGSKAKILEAGIYNPSPKNLRVSFFIEKETLKINPLLLNPRDSFTVKIIAESSSAIELGGRIVGVNKINKVSGSYLFRVATTSFIWIVVLALSFWIGSGFLDFRVPFLLLSFGFTFYFGSAILPRLIDWAKNGT